MRRRGCALARQRSEARCKASAASLPPQPAMAAAWRVGRAGAARRWPAARARTRATRSCGGAAASRQGECALRCSRAVGGGRRLRHEGRAWRPVLGWVMVFVLEGLRALRHSLRHESIIPTL